MGIRRLISLFPALARQLGQQPEGFRELMFGSQTELEGIILRKMPIFHVPPELLVSHVQMKCIAMALLGIDEAKAPNNVVRANTLFFHHP